MNEQLKPCPFCGGEVYVAYRCGTAHDIECKNNACVARVTFKDRTDRTPLIAAWNRRPAPANDPLTLEELRGMSTDPLKHWVWIENLEYPGNSGYMRNHLDWSDGERFPCGWPGTGYSPAYADYGKTWLAYRRKPEEVAK